MKKSEILVNVVNVILVIACIAIVIFTIYVLANDTLKNEKDIIILKNEVETLKECQEEKVMLNLSCSGEVLIFGAVNGVHKEQLPSLEVTTPYPTTMYQVIGQNNIVIQNEKYVKENTKVNKFNLEGVTEEVTQIRLFAFDESGNQIDCKTYDIVFLE